MSPYRFMDLGMLIVTLSLGACKAFFPILSTHPCEGFFYFFIFFNVRFTYFTPGP